MGKSKRLLIYKFHWFCLHFRLRLAQPTHRCIYWHYVRKSKCCDDNEWKIQSNFRFVGILIKTDWHIKPEINAKLNIVTFQPSKTTQSNNALFYHLLLYRCVLAWKNILCVHLPDCFQFISEMIKVCRYCDHSLRLFKSHFINFERLSSCRSLLNGKLFRSGHFSGSNSKIAWTHPEYYTFRSSKNAWIITNRLVVWKFCGHVVSVRCTKSRNQSP